MVSRGTLRRADCCWQLDRGGGGRRRARVLGRDPVSINISKILWPAKSQSRNYIDLCIGPHGMAGGDEIQDSDVFTFYDLYTRSFILRGESFDVQAILNELDDIDSL